MSEKNNLKKEAKSSPLLASDVISFLFEHLREGQENEILATFDEAPVIFLTDIYGKKETEDEIYFRFKNNYVEMNIYESAYLRLLLDFGYIKPRRVDEKIENVLVLYELLSETLFCVAVDFVMALSEEEKKIFAADEGLLRFLDENIEDGNIKYIKKTIYGQV